MSFESLVAAAQNLNTEQRLAAIAKIASLVPCDPPRQEINRATGAHRLVSADGQRSTSWAAYTDVCYLDGRVGCTACQMRVEGVYTPDEYLAEIAHTHCLDK